MCLGSTQDSQTEPGEIGKGVGVGERRGCRVGEVGFLKQLFPPEVSERQSRLQTSSF